MIAKLGFAFIPRHFAWPDDRHDAVRIRRTTGGRMLPAGNLVNKADPKALAVKPMPLT